MTAIEVQIERVLPSLFTMTGSEASVAAARAAADRLLDFLDTMVERPANEWSITKNSQQTW